jgi:SAM-dependent methyltransferase
MDHIEDFLTLLYPELQKPLRQCRVLDLGSSRGTLAVPAAKHVRAVVAVDTSASAIREGEAWAGREGLDNVTFLHRSALDVDEGLFDVVLCSDIVEHVADQDGFVATVARSLAPGGAYYLSTNNRWWPLEGHYGLPFLSYLPRPWANRYFRILGSAREYDIYPLSIRQLTSLLERHRLTWVLKSPRTARTLVQRIGRRLIRIHPGFWHLANAFQVVGTRRDDGPR